MLKGEFWQPKLRTLAAMTRLAWAQFLVMSVPFGRWRGTLGFHAQPVERPLDLEQARRLAADVEWAAKRLPGEVRCLPRAMALSWMMRRRRIGHALVIAVRPSDHRSSPDALHAWVESGGEKILGNLPGPWIETFRAGS